jgi:hypothetical protein
MFIGNWHSWLTRNGAGIPASDSGRPISSCASRRAVAVGDSRRESALPPGRAAWPASLDGSDHGWETWGKGFGNVFWRGTGKGGGDRAYSCSRFLRAWSGRRGARPGGLRRGGLALRRGGRGGGRSIGLVAGCKLGDGLLLPFWVFLLDDGRDISIVGVLIGRDQNGGGPIHKTGCPRFHRTEIENIEYAEIGKAHDEHKMRQSRVRSD